MVVDASVVVSRLVPHDVHHEASRRWPTRHLAGSGLVIAPALLLPEVASAVARRTGEPRLARRAVDAMLRVPGLRLVPVDDVLARMAARLARRLRAREADAIYITAAATLRLPLVTWDIEQRDRAARLVEVLVPDGRACLACRGRDASFQRRAVAQPSPDARPRQAFAVAVPRMGTPSSEDSIRDAIAREEARVARLDSRMLSSLAGREPSTSRTFSSTPRTLTTCDTCFRIG